MSTRQIIVGHVHTSTLCTAGWTVFSADMLLLYSDVGQLACHDTPGTVYTVFITLDILTVGPEVDRRTFDHRHRNPLSRMACVW